jgi:hypothetical protein
MRTTKKNVWQNRVENNYSKNQKALGVVLKSIPRVSNFAFYTISDLRNCLVFYPLVVFERLANQCPMAIADFPRCKQIIPF